MPSRSRGPASLATLPATCHWTRPGRPTCTRCGPPPPTSAFQAPKEGEGEAEENDDDDDDDDDDDGGGGGKASNAKGVGARRWRKDSTAEMAERLDDDDVMTMMAE
jgi:hypothetical protein